MTDSKPPTHALRAQYTDLRTPDGALAGRYDPQRGVLEIKVNGSKYYFDLAMVYNAGQRTSDTAKEAAR
jgi:hypothetical protein